MKIFKFLLIAFTAVILLAGCKAVESDEASIFPDGTYSDDFGGTHVFTTTQWTDSFGAAFTVIDTNEEEKYIIYQNSASNTYNPSKFSRVDFTLDSNDNLYYCQIAYDKDTVAMAEAVADADANDLAGGCSGFAWSKLTPAS
jgi:hypothetical protein